MDRMPHHAPGWHGLTPKPFHCPPGRTKSMEGKEGVLRGRCPSGDITQCPHSVSSRPAQATHLPAPTLAQRPQPLWVSSQGSYAEPDCPSAACPFPVEGPTHCSAQHHFQSTHPLLRGIFPQFHHYVNVAAETRAVSLTVLDSFRNCRASTAPFPDGPEARAELSSCRTRKFLVPKAGLFSGQS